MAKFLLKKNRDECCHSQVENGCGLPVTVNRSVAVLFSEGMKLL
jgi:hypothetical protein